MDINSVLIISKEEKILDHNSTFIKMFGYKDLKELKKTNFWNLFQKKEEADEIKKELEEKMKIENKELVMKTHEGEEIIVLSNMFIEKKDKKPKIIAYIFNITERKRLERQLFHAQKMSTIGTFAGGIAHDFNNMLTVIKGYSSLILREADKNTKIYRLKSPHSRR